MDDATPLPFDLPAVARKKLTVDFDGGNQSSDGGVLAVACRRAEDRHHRPARRRRCPTGAIIQRVRHHLAARSSVRACSASAAAMRTASITTGLRDDPALKMAVGRAPETGAPLASQSTISRFENAPSRTDAARLAAALVDQFTARVTPVPSRHLRHRRHVRCGARRPAAHVLERASRRARLRADARLPRRQRLAGGGDPAASEDASGHRGSHGHQASDETHP